MEAKPSCETWVTTRPPTRRRIPEDLVFHQRRCENTKSRISINCAVM